MGLPWPMWCWASVPWQPMCTNGATGSKTGGNKKEACPADRLLFYDGLAAGKDLPKAAAHAFDGDINKRHKHRITTNHAPVEAVAHRVQQEVNYVFGQLKG